MGDDLTFIPQILNLILEDQTKIENLLILTLSPMEDDLKIIKLQR